MSLICIMQFDQVDPESGSASASCSLIRWIQNPHPHHAVWSDGYRIRILIKIKWILSTSFFFIHFNNIKFNLQIKYHFRGKGIGKYLMLKTEEFCKNLGKLIYFKKSLFVYILKNKNNVKTSTFCMKDYFSNNKLFRTLKLFKTSFLLLSSFVFI